MSAPHALLLEAELLHRLALAVGSAEALDEVAQLGVEAAERALPGRGVQLQLWSDSLRGGSVGANAGPEMSEFMHRQALASGGQPVGELVVDAGEVQGAPFGIDGRRVITMIAITVAAAAARVMRQSERDSAQTAAVLALATLAEKRDNETGRHLRRVAAFSRTLAESLRALGHFTDVMTDSWISDLERSAPLHDVGKVGIPDAVLLKPGKLSDAEWELMKTHTTIGAATIEEVMAQTPHPGFLVMGRDIALAHHEKWDGSGYPRGLAGEDIPLAARVLALSDVYDALTSERPYKEAWSHARAVEWISAQAGKHFDARIVAAFRARVDAFDRIRRDLADAREPLAMPVAA
ncbi:MAG: HD domain-containing phosphohydrolase [Planctomycetota bacterium]